MKSKGIQRVIFDQKIFANSNLLRASIRLSGSAPRHGHTGCIVFVTGTTIHTIPQHAT
jgi:hypothetical protein